MIRRAGVRPQAREKGDHELALPCLQSAQIRTQAAVVGGARHEGGRILEIGRKPLLRPARSLAVEHRRDADLSDPQRPMAAIAAHAPVHGVSLQAILRPHVEVAAVCGCSAAVNWRTPFATAATAISTAKPEHQLLAQLHAFTPRAAALSEHDVEEQLDRRVHDDQQDAYHADAQNDPLAPLQSRQGGPPR